MDTGVAELYSMSTQATNTGDNLKLWIDTIGIRKRVLEEKSIINHSNLYRQFKADKVDWHLIAKMHNYLREFYDYNIRDFFPDFPEKLDNTMHVEFVGTDEKLKRLATDRDIWKEKYMALLEKHTQLQDYVLNEFKKLSGRHETLMNNIMSNILDK